MNKEFCVYLIERNDGLLYIGKTNYKKLKYRIAAHLKGRRNDTRFAIGIKKYEVLYISEDHSLIEDAETFYIKYINTFEKGLNRTKDGKAFNNNSYRFTTYGMSMKEDTKAKIGQKSSARNAALVLQEWRRNLNEEEKLKFFLKMSSIRKGRVPKNAIKYKEKDVIEFYKLFLRRPFIDNVDTKALNGRILTYERLFAKLYSKQFNMSEAQAYNILKNRVERWKQPILNLIQNMKY